MLLNSDGTDRTHFVKGIVKSKRKDVYGSLSHRSPQITVLPQLRNSSEIPHMFLFREALQTSMILHLHLEQLERVSWTVISLCIFFSQCLLKKQTCISDMCWVSRFSLG